MTNSPPHTLNLIGLRFGLLFVLRRAGSSPDRHSTWTCLCDCGTTVVVRGDKLRSGDVVSCGHYRRSVLAQYNFKPLETA
jgi:hypothetical protein